MTQNIRLKRFIEVPWKNKSNLLHGCDQYSDSILIMQWTQKVIFYVAGHQAWLFKW